MGGGTLRASITEACYAVTVGQSSLSYSKMKCVTLEGRAPARGLNFRRLREVQAGTLPEKRKP